MSLLPKKRDYLRSCMFHGVVFVLVCGYGSTLYADSANVVVPAAATNNAYQQRRVISDIVSQYAADVFQNIPVAQIPTTTVYVPNKPLSPGGCTTSQIRVGANPPMNYDVQMWYYASSFTYYCSKGTATDCTNYAVQEPQFTPEITQPQTTQPGTVCKAQGPYAPSATPPTPACQVSDTHCNYLCRNPDGSLRFENEKWYTVYVYKPNLKTGTFQGAATCITHGWATNPVN